MFECLKSSITKGSSQSLDSLNGILFPSAFFSTSRSLSSADLSIYLMGFCLRSRGLITAKKLEAALCLATEYFGPKPIWKLLHVKHVNFYTVENKT